MKKIILFFLLQLAVISETVAQCEPPRFVHPTVSNASAVIQENFRLGEIPAPLRCSQFVGYAKFFITETGQVVDITFSRDLALSIRKSFQAAIESTQGYWYPEVKDGLPVRSQPFLLILVASFQTDCGKEGVEEEYDAINPLKEMVNYDPYKAYQTIECNMLQPIFISSTP